MRHQSSARVPLDNIPEFHVDRLKVKRQAQRTKGGTFERDASLLIYALSCGVYQCNRRQYARASKNTPRARRTDNGGCIHLFGRLTFRTVAVFMRGYWFLRRPAPRYRDARQIASAISRDSHRSGPGRVNQRHGRRFFTSRRSLSLCLSRNAAAQDSQGLLPRSRPRGTNFTENEAIAIERTGGSLAGLQLRTRGGKCSLARVIGRNLQRDARIAIAGPSR